MTVTTLLLLYIAFRMKQYICDFVLQNNWIGQNKGTPTKTGYQALAFHIIFHGIGTTIVALIFAPSLWWLGVLDVLIHGVIDKAKAMATHFFGWDTTDRFFWLSLGLDQEAHNFTHLAYILVIVNVLGGIQIG